MSRLCIVTAMAAETRPFLDHWQFKAQQTGRLRSFRCEDYLLLQTGVGKLKAAASVSAFLQMNPEIHAVVNIGIAGGTEAINTLLMAHKIEDRATGAHWFPHLPNPRQMNPSMRKLPTCTVVTVDQPCDHYESGIVYDMEASGVLSAATLYLSTTQIHSIKIVSDNPSSPMPDSFKSIGQKTTQLIENRIDDIKKLLEILLCSCSDPVSTFNQQTQQLCELIQHKIHHTRNEQLALNRMLAKLHSLGIDPQLETCLKLENAAGVFHFLEQRLCETNIKYKTKYETVNRKEN
ncbi:MAG: hypothetical protein KTR32_04500 [Granulosicoccus sp.]|nr:hypothetical protein [Granulosicoccus sp.]